VTFETIFVWAGQADAHGASQFGHAEACEAGGHDARAAVAGLVGAVDELGQFGGDLGGSDWVGVRFGGHRQVTQDVGQAQLVFEWAQLLAVAGAVAVVDGHGTGFQVLDDEGQEGLHGAVTE
jgi:hypothetical protein